MSDHSEERSDSMAYEAVQNPRIGWIGAGRMGLPLCTRLVKAGYDVAIYNRTGAKCAPAVAQGATAVPAPADLADRDVVFSMVSASADLIEVTTGERGVLSVADVAPALLVDHTTVSLQASADARAAAAKRGTDFLAAPVSGNPKVVEAGLLTVAVSGPRATFDQALPLLQLLGRAVTYVGEDEVARLVKIAHNVFLGVVTQSLAEITVLAEKGGASRAAFLDFLNKSVLGSVFTRYKTPAFVNLDFAATFTNPLLLKDLQLGLDAAHDLEAPMPLAAATAALVASAIGAGYRTEDFATLLIEQARRGGVDLQPENVLVDDGLGGAR
jgi:3-hydroxyisobutyrate dehydrogenase